MVIPYKVLTIVLPLTFIPIECLNNKILEQFIDQLTIESVHVIIEMSKLISYI